MEDMPLLLFIYDLRVYNESTAFKSKKDYRAVGLLQEGMRQVDVSERIGISQRDISREWKRFQKTGTPAEKLPEHRRSTTAAQDKFLILSARRQPLITTLN